MKATLEYIIAFTTILVIFSYFAVENYVSTMSAAGVVDQDTFARKVEAYMDILVDTSGQPRDWGYVQLTYSGQRVTDIDWIPPRRLGLRDPRAEEPYTLAPEKITALAEGMFTEEDVIAATGMHLQLRLVLKPMLSVSIEPSLAGSTVTYYVTVTVHPYTPAAQARLRAILVYTVPQTGSSAELRSYLANGATDSNGFAEISFDVPPSEVDDFLDTGVLTVYVEYGLLRGVGVYRHGDGGGVIDGYICGDTLLLYMPESSDQGARHVGDEVVVATPSKVYTVLWDTTQGENNNIVNKGGKNVLPIQLPNLDPDVYLVAGSIKFRGVWRTFAVLHPLVIEGGGLVFVDIGNVDQAYQVYTARRYVTAGGVSYVVELSMGT